MAKIKWICKNVDNCDKAFNNNGKSFEDLIGHDVASQFEPYKCEECGKDLVEVKAPGTKIDGKKIGIVAALLAVVCVIGGGIYWGVMRPPPPPPMVTITPDNPTVKVDETVTLTVQTVPEVKKSSKWNWTSSNESIATVSDIGEVKGVSAGSVTITATEGKSKASESVKVVVQSGHVPVESVTLSQPSLSLDLKENKSTALTVTVLPENATNKNVEWDSSEKSVTTVDNGVVTALKAGTAVITVRTVDGSDKTATCTVTVRPGNGPPPPNCSTPKSYSFGRYNGGQTLSNGNCIPHGQGTMAYTRRIQIAQHGTATVFAEPGDVFTGTWYNGDIEHGILRDGNNNIKVHVNAGRRPNPYNLQ